LRSPIYLETTAAWYILGAPVSEYRALFAPFFRAHKIAQVFVCTLMREPQTDLDAFIVELQLTDCMVLNDVLGDSSRWPDMRDVQDAVRFPPQRSLPHII
jgi:Cytosine specific DNA methyltransferase replication foci domain